MSIKRVGIVGSGIMGSGIAEVAAAAGYEVVLRSRSQGIYHFRLLGRRRVTTLLLTARWFGWQTFT